MSIKIRIQVTDRNIQNVSVVREERITVIPLDELTTEEQRSLLDGLQLWADKMKESLEDKIREVGLTRTTL